MDYKFAEIATIMTEAELKKEEEEAVVETTHAVVGNAHNCTHCGESDMAEADAQFTSTYEAKHEREDPRENFNFALIQLDMAIMRLELAMQTRLEASVEARQEWERSVSRLTEFLKHMKPYLRLTPC